MADDTTAGSDSGDTTDTGGPVQLCLQRHPLAELTGIDDVRFQDVDGDGVPQAWLVDDVWDPQHERQNISLTAWSIDDSGGMQIDVMQSVGGAARVFVDVDGDGHLDLVAMDWMRDNAMFWLPGTEDGTFVDSPTPFAWPGGDLVFRDFGPPWRDVDGDGIADVFVGEDTQLRLWVGDGTGGFAPAGLTPLGLDYPEALAPVAGASDLVVALSGNGAIGFGLQSGADVLRVDAGGALASLAQWAPGDGTFEIVLAQDRVGDPGIDLLVRYQDTSAAYVRLLTSNGAGFDETSLAESVRDIRAGDFEGTGQPSVLVVDDAQQVQLWRGTGDPSEDAVALQGQLGPTPDGNFVRSVGDFDGDGADELIVYHGDSTWELAQVVPCE